MKKAYKKLHAVLICLILIVIFSLNISFAARAAGISPEAEKFLENLHKKVSGIESLSWEIESKPSESTIKGYYRQGGLLRSQIKYAAGDYQYDYFITPEKCLMYIPRLGDITEGIKITITDFWFVLPLLHIDTLKNCGDVTVREDAIDNKNYTILEISVSSLQPGVKSEWRHKYYFDSGELKLDKIEYYYGQGPGQILKVKEYEKILDYYFPVKIEAPYTGLSVKNIQLNPILSNDLFNLEDKNALTYFSKLSEEEINVQLSKKPDDPDLHYTLAKFYQYKKRDDFFKAAEEYKKVISLKPGAKAGYLGLASFYSSQANKKEEAAQIYEDIISKFPDNIDSAYQGLVFLYQHHQPYDLDKSLKWAEEWTQKRPDSPQAWSSLAPLLEQKNELDKASEVYEKVLAMPQISEYAKNHGKLNLSKIYLKQGKKAEAEKMFKSILDQEDTGYNRYIIQETQKELFKYYQAEGKLDKIKEETLALLKGKPDDTKLLKQLAEIYKAKSDYKNAAEIYEKLITLNPDDQFLYSELARIYSEAGEKEKQIKLYEDLIKKFPSLKGQYLSQLIWAYQSAGKTEKALEKAEEYLKENPDNPNALSLMASLYQQSNKTEKAIELYKKAIDLSVDKNSKQNLQINLARIYKETGKNEEAEKLINQILKSEPPDWAKSEANRLLVEIMRSSNRLNELIQSLEEKIKSKPDDIESLKQLAEIYHGNRDYDKSAEIYRKLIGIKPDKNYYSMLARSLSDAKRYKEAIEVYEECFKKFPEERGDYLNNLMWAYKNAGETEKALKLAEEFIKENADKAYAYSTAGNFYQNLQQYDKAIETYKKVIELEQNADTRARHMLQIGEIYSQQNKYKEAEQAFEQAEQMSKQEEVKRDAGRRISELYRKMGKGDEIIKRYEAKLKENPQDVDILTQLAEIYDMEGNLEKAIELYKRASELKPEDRNRLYQLGDAYKNAKKYNEGIEIFEQLITKFPANKRDYLNSLMWAYKEAGRNGEAVKTAEENIKENSGQAYVYHNAANLYRDLKQHDKALEMYKEACKYEKSDYQKEHYFSEIAKIYAEKGETDKLKELSRQMNELHIAQIKRTPIRIPDISFDKYIKRGMPLVYSVDVTCFVPKGDIVLTRLVKSRYFEKSKTLEEVLSEISKETGIKFQAEPPLDLGQSEWGISSGSRELIYVLETIREMKGCSYKIGENVITFYELSKEELLQEIFNEKTTVYDRFMAIHSLAMNKNNFDAVAGLIDDKKLDNDSKQVAFLELSKSSREKAINKYIEVLNNARSSPSEKGMAAFAWANIEKDRALEGIVGAILKYEVDSSLLKDTFNLCNLEKAEDYLSELFKNEKDESIRGKISQLARTLVFEERKFQELFNQTASIEINNVSISSATGYKVRSSRMPDHPAISALTAIKPESGRDGIFWILEDGVLYRYDLKQNMCSKIEDIQGKVKSFIPGNKPDSLFISVEDKLFSLSYNGSSVKELKIQNIDLEKTLFLQDEIAFQAIGKIYFYKQDFSGYRSIDMQGEFRITDTGEAQDEFWAYSENKLGKLSLKEKKIDFTDISRVIDKEVAPIKTMLADKTASENLWFIWTDSRIGKCKDDFSNWSMFDMKEVFGSSSLNITSMAFDSDYIWLGTDLGLARFDRKYSKWSRVAIKAEIIEADVKNLFIDSSSNLLWVITSKGVYSFDRLKNTWNSCLE